MSVDEVFDTPSHIDARRKRPNHPKGWEPGIAWGGSEGTVISDPTTERDPEWDNILQHFQFDPEKFEVVEPIEVRSWEGFIKTDDGKIEKTTLWYHKAKIIRRFDDEARADIDALIREIKRHRPAKRTPPNGDRALVVGFSDWQIGKEGTAEAVQRILEDIDDVARRVRDLRKLGESIDTLYLANLGDSMEHCAGHYAQQTYTVELNEVEQMRLTRRLWVTAVKKLAPLVGRVVVVTVPGNHPEHRDASGKSYTDFNDNDDIEVIAQVGEIMAENPDAYGHVSFVLPDDQLTVTLDVCGTIVTFAHGHQFAKSKYVEKAVWEWWEGHALGMQPAGDAAILVSGHRHHFAMQQKGPRTWIQCPTIDSGSTWYENKTGEPSNPGTLTFVVGPDGWDHIRVL